MASPPDAAAPAPDPLAVLLDPTEDNLEVAGRALREGRCVAFPTETVYGLGANALDASAVANVFK